MSDDSVGESDVDLIDLSDDDDHHRELDGSDYATPNSQQISLGVDGHGESILRMIYRPSAAKPMGTDEAESSDDDAQESASNEGSLSIRNDNDDAGHNVPPSPPSSNPDNDPNDSDSNGNDSDDSDDSDVVIRRSQLRSNRSSSSNQQTAVGGNPGDDPGDDGWEDYSDSDSDDDSDDDSDNERYEFVNPDAGIIEALEQDHIEVPDWHGTCFQTCEPHYRGLGLKYLEWRRLFAIKRNELERCKARRRVKVARLNRLVEALTEAVREFYAANEVNIEENERLNRENENLRLLLPEEELEDFPEPNPLKRDDMEARLGEQMLRRLPRSVKEYLRWWRGPAARPRKTEREWPKVYTRWIRLGQHPNYKNWGEVCKLICKEENMPWAFSKSKPPKTHPHLKLRPPTDEEEAKANAGEGQGCTPLPVCEEMGSDDEESEEEQEIQPFRFNALPRELQLKILWNTLVFKGELIHSLSRPDIYYEPSGYMRRKHEPEQIVGFLAQKTENQPNFRRYRSLRNLQGADYLYCLRGMQGITFWDYDKWREGGVKLAVRDWTLIRELNQEVRSPKSGHDEHFSRLRYLAPMYGYRPSQSLAEQLEEILRSEPQDLGLLLPPPDGEGLYPQPQAALDRADDSDDGGDDGGSNDGGFDNESSDNESNADSGVGSDDMSDDSDDDGDDDGQSQELYEYRHNIDQVGTRIRELLNVVESDPEADDDVWPGNGQLYDLVSDDEGEDEEDNDGEDNDGEDNDKVSMPPPPAPQQNRFSEDAHEDQGKSRDRSGSLFVHSPPRELQPEFVAKIETPSPSRTPPSAVPVRLQSSSRADHSEATPVRETSTDSNMFMSPTPYKTLNPKAEDQPSADDYLRQIGLRLSSSPSSSSAVLSARSISIGQPPGHSKRQWSVLSRDENGDDENEVQYLGSSPKGMRHSGDDDNGAVQYMGNSPKRVRPADDDDDGLQYMGSSPKRVCRADDDESDAGGASQVI
ncbi:hypothetical protein F53441_4559 [Fusarium austroafricanum]|uniref:Uncharacterized protein n=1 Tax=Fusarium austroafricanum TaxID=2364996 RepID=A0A8H4KJW0_9HYPO|nr:hypothetical protein F53441_4559 [Fusarium austroafricanum]